jgi:hypothetical protein
VIGYFAAGETNIGFRPDQPIAGINLRCRLETRYSLLATPGEDEDYVVPHPRRHAAVPSITLAEESPPCPYRTLSVDG